MKNKEQVYDEQIFPLMAKILEITKEHNIAVVASFAIPTEENPDLYVSSRMQDENGEYPSLLLDMALAIDKATKAPSPLNMTLEHGDGKKTMVTILP